MTVTLQVPAYGLENTYVGTKELQVFHTLLEHDSQIGVISDLHLDCNKWITPSMIDDVCRKKNVTVLFVGGDVHRKLGDVYKFLNSLSKDLQIIYVIGNHELFGYLDYNECVSYIRHHLDANITMLADECCYIAVEQDKLTVSDEPVSDAFNLRVYGTLGWDGFRLYLDYDNISNIPRREYEKLCVSGIPTICFTHYPVYFKHPDIICYIHSHTHGNLLYSYCGKPVISRYQVGRYHRELDVFTPSELVWNVVDIDSMESPCRLTWEQYVNWFLKNSNVPSCISGNRGRWEYVWCVHSDGYYMFFVKGKNKNRDKWLLLRGGQPCAVFDDLLYFNARIEDYVQLCKVILESSGFKRKLDYVQQAVRDFGGTGRIHGCIVDIDYCSHVFIHPKTLACTWYHAINVKDKWVYEDPRYLFSISLLTSKAYESGLVRSYSDLFPTGPLSDLCVYTSDTSYVRMSNRVYSLQDTLDNHIIKRWEYGILLDYESTLQGAGSRLLTTDKEPAQVVCVVENDAYIKDLQELTYKINSDSKKLRVKEIVVIVDTYNRFKNFNPDLNIVECVTANWDMYESSYMLHRSYSDSLDICVERALRHVRDLEQSSSGGYLCSLYKNKITELRMSVVNALEQEWRVLLRWRYPSKNGKRYYAKKWYTWSDIEMLSNKEVYR